ncbi:nucleotidyl transferase AbiEii/AbiGii toxin family protein [bacterium]|nr:nucleotidyl transferase AbiEii/AbiGii toxin family protein [bacterium]
MIHPDCFTIDWLQAKRREIRAGDPALLERALHALALLGHLAESGLDFVFKGGTSLLLHVPVIRRLSIDIDILCGAPPEELIRALDEVSKISPFIRYQEDSRGARGLPNRRHFRFFYNPLLPGNPSPYVFLDVVEEHDVPHDVIEKSIAPRILDIRREVFVKVPTIESLLADKLCAFAPRTIGVPFEPENGHAADSMQIVKQLV